MRGVFRATRVMGAGEVLCPDAHFLMAAGADRLGKFVSRDLGDTLTRELAAQGRFNVCYGSIRERFHLSRPRAGACRLRLTGQRQSQAGRCGAGAGCRAARRRS